MKDVRSLEQNKLRKTGSLTKDGVMKESRWDFEEKRLKILKERLEKKEAKKQAEDNVAIIEDQQVYEWAVHYFLEDSLDFEPKENPSKKKNKHDDKEEEETEKVETLFGEDEVVKEKKKSIPKETKTKKDIKKKLFDQISLFDL